MKALKTLWFRVKTAAQLATFAFLALWIDLIIAVLAAATEFKEEWRWQFYDTGRTLGAMWRSLKRGE